MFVIVTEMTRRFEFLWFQKLPWEALEQEDKYIEGTTQA